ncbi:hypothetical protein [Aeromicrobium duanguangcaii]|uniref:Uncharacterized protein n=1 Tax=Aeromicrobium duanguangcaii TaxID=2968086 RepID=A0ABY5KDP9_9ACTN|nr:hypothetical protein [Aeromicrobium duanguangcaii]MCD9154353.1 hypothetical protein [Aeromicrobium duanguangcaii]UUI68581.1 hypothetical protein NP095_00245 [Aeromicrobium duanguangcaii]
MTSQVRDQSSWGRSRFGGGTAVLLAGCTGAALAVSGALALWALTGLDGSRRDEILLVAFVSLPSIFAMAWVALVDPGSIRDAVQRPDDTIESQWLQRAQSGAFTDLLLVLGVVLVAGVIVDLAVSLRVALIALTSFAMADVGVRLVWIRRREG